MSTMLQRILGAITGGLLGTLVLILLFYVLQIAMELFDVGRSRVRVPVFLIVLPFLGMWYGYKLAPELIANQFSPFSDAKHVFSGSMIMRLALVAPAVWLVSVVAFVFFFEPYGYRMRDDDYLHLAKVIAFPVGIFWLCIASARYVVRGPTSKDR